MKIGSNKIIEHVFENLIYEIPVVFVIKMNNEEEPTTVELDLNIHSTL